MRLETLKNMLDVQNPIVFKGQCCCCGDSAEVTATLKNTTIVIKGGSTFRPPVEWNVKDAYLVKCQKCWSKDPILFPITEVHTRTIENYAN